MVHAQWMPAVHHIVRLLSVESNTKLFGNGHRIKVNLRLHLPVQEIPQGNFTVACVYVAHEKLTYDCQGISYVQTRITRTRSSQ